MDKITMEQNRKEEVVKLLQSMKISKNQVNGFAKEDVYSCIQSLYNLYERDISQLEEEMEKERKEMEQNLTAKQKEMEKMFQYKQNEGNTDYKL